MYPAVRCAAVCRASSVLVIIITRDKKNEPGERNSRDRCVDLLSVFPCNQTAGPGDAGWEGRVETQRKRNSRETY